MVGVALGWELYERTGDPFALGLMGLFEVIPVLLLSLPAGHLSDHASRRKIVIITKSILLLCSLALAVLSATAGAIWMYYVCILCIGIARAYQNPASSNLIQLTVPRDLLPSAITWHSNAWQLASALGPAVGGGLLALINPLPGSGATTITPWVPLPSGVPNAVLVYLLDAVFGLAFVAAVASIRGKEEIRPRTSATWDSVKEGLRFLRHSPILLSAITLDLFAVLFGGAVALLPVFAKDVLHVGPRGLGIMNAMPSLGAVVAALWLAHRPPFRRAGMTLMLSVAGFGAATIVFGLSQLFWLSLAMLFLMGALDGISVVIRSTLLLVRVPDVMRGRVAAVNSIFVGASNELGAFESGVASRFFGVIPATVGGGIITILVVIAVAFVWPQLRELGAIQEEHPSDRDEED
jgi:MFS family permease